MDTRYSGFGGVLWREILALQKRLRELTAIVASGGTVGDLSGDVTTSGSNVTTIANDAVSNGKLANMAQATFKMRAAGSGTGDPIDGTPDQASTVLDGASDPFVRTSDLPGGGVASIQVTIDGGGSAITTGIKCDIRIPTACTITKATLLADQSGSIVVDVWKDTYANYPPTGGDSITASTKPTITTATKSQDSSLTGWTTSISAGDTLRFNVDSCTSITRVQLELEVTI